jgi:hypothetical protein
VALTGGLERRYLDRNATAILPERAAHVSISASIQSAVKKSSKSSILDFSREQAIVVRPVSRNDPGCIQEE